MSSLRDYQQEALQFALTHPRCLIEMDMRMGKTAVVASALRELQVRVQYPRVLIVCPSSVLYFWPDECMSWGFGKPESFGIAVGGRPAARTEIWQNYPVVITTAATLVRDANDPEKVRYVRRQGWDIVILDESHIVRNRKVKTYVTLRNILLAHKSARLIMLSGTQSREGAKDYFTTAALCDPPKFTSYWRFVDQYCYVDHNGWGYEVHGTRNTTEFNKVMSNYRFVKRRHEVGMPAKTRTILPYQISGNQKKIYKQLESELLAMLDGEIVAVSPLVMTSMLRLRQLLVHPSVAIPDHNQALGPGAALELIVDHIFSSGTKKVAIFTPFKKAFPYIREYLQQRVKTSHQSLRLLEFSGDNKPIETQHNSAEFTSSRSSLTVALCSIKYSLGFSLRGAEASYMLGQEWTPDENAQAEDRMVDMAGKLDANVYYPMCKGSIDEYVIATLIDKGRAVRLASPEGCRQIIGFKKLVD